jgi:hypothetical protein
MGAETFLAKTPGDSNVPIQQFCGDDRPALATLLDQHRERLRRMVVPARPGTCRPRTP